MDNQTSYQHQTQQPAPVGPPRSNFWKYLVTVLVTALVTFSLTAGGALVLMLVMSPAQPPVATGGDGSLALRFEDDPATRDALSKLQSVFSHLQDDYYDDLSDAELIEAMTRGMVNEMDSPYTMYLTADQARQINESMTGRYSGIGAYVALDPDGIVAITDIVENSPAEAAGLMIGDLFYEVNGTDVSDYGDINAVAALVRGVEGTTVDLRLYRPSLGDYIDVTVERRLITTENVTSRMLTPLTGYVHIRDFSVDSGRHFIEAVQNLQQNGVLEIVVDLRHNSGGLASEVIEMLDYLLPETEIASLKGRTDGQAYDEVWMSDAAVGVPADMRYAILVNQWTASASELFSGCLRDYDKAYLIGEQTLGKGSGTITQPLPDGSAINITNFLYYLPGGESIEGVGLTPDLELALPDELIGLPVNRIPEDEDVQLQAALDYFSHGGE
ncbi:MAG: S41 family peptidase [Clostridia bacterium]|nr:S41 family peptidase [Eubacteriales bacterium]MDD3866128.1 S41 family peptidase [Eubacteriales bacterium]MDD4461688.1 S41 family peptidase [Eubacteriales bacterium]NCC48315.1 S41 family peptidase [Clostridia bacterium]